VATRPKSAKKDLGRLLLDRAWADEEQLRLALERQRRSGGALSTALLELDVLSEGRLLTALAELHSLPPAGATELATIPSTVIALLSPREASRYRVVPFAAVGGRADVATDRPDALEDLDELSFLLGKRLALHVTTEVRLADALERYYGIARPARLGDLVARLTGAPRPSQPKVGPPAAPEALADATSQGSHWSEVEEETRAPSITSRFRPLSPTVAPDPRRVISLTAEERQALSGTGAPSEPVGGARLLEDALVRLQLAASASQVGDTLLQTLAGDFELVALLRPRRSRWVGWLGAGHGLASDRLRACEFGDSEPSFLLELEPGVDLWTGGLAPLPAHGRLAASWGGDLAGEFTAAGVRLGERLVCVLVGRRKPNHVPALDDGALRELASAAARAFQTLLAGEREDDR
jgi:hypothetical protein